MWWALDAGTVNWIAKSNQDIVDATMLEIARLFPLEVGAGAPDGVGAKLLKHAVVKTPRSVYAAIPGQGLPDLAHHVIGTHPHPHFLKSVSGLVSKIWYPILLDQSELHFDPNRPTRRESDRVTIVAE
jgi:hypothetical protein